ncbi:hypothetical protein E2C01_091337 [Portunus trituberculatus]|uniref:Uncharacterized protein n=1 Tax=Portunus trituberculatus TaxID=210409 RepID=A0A5B7JMP6_PORTR|nr:hypothetical protein [Portunus trituberculatus]
MAEKYAISALLPSSVIGVALILETQQRSLSVVCVTGVGSEEIEEFKSDLKSITAKADKMMEIVDNKMAKMEEISIKVDEATVGLTARGRWVTEYC